MFVGKIWRAWICGCLVVLSAHAQAELIASVDRNVIAVGESVRLTLQSNAGERLDRLDLSVLQFDWEILSRSSSTNRSFGNGRRETTRILELDLMPKRDGVLSIPAFGESGKRTTPIAVTVQPQIIADADDDSVRFSAEISKSDVYIQEQLTITVTVEQAINLDGASVTPLDIDGAIVEELSRRNFQRQINGRLWRVTQLRYAVYPQERGLLQIPALELTAREVLPGRSLLGARLGKRFVLKIDPKVVTVKPVPAAFPGDVWLPASSLELSQSWSTAPETMTVSDSTTRTLKLTAVGLLGSQLPSLTSISGSTTATGLQVYPDQESSDQVERNEGFISTRTRSEAILASTGGTWTLPEISVPWWNTQTDTLEYARLPSTTIEIQSPAVALPVPSTPSVTTASIDQTGSSPLMWIFALSGWLAAAALAILVWLRRPQTKPSQTTSFETRAKPLISAIKAAVKRSDPITARALVIQWASLHFGIRYRALDDVRAAASARLSQELATLDTALFSSTDGDWNGDGLVAAITEEPMPNKGNQAPISTLYPTR